MQTFDSPEPSSTAQSSFPLSSTTVDSSFADGISPLTFAYFTQQEIGSISDTLDDQDKVAKISEIENRLKKELLQSDEDKKLEDGQSSMLHDSFEESSTLPTSSQKAPIEVLSYISPATYV